MNQSKLLTSIDKDIYWIARKIRILPAILPTNLLKEKKRFLKSGFTYNPQFRYRKKKIHTKNLLGNLDKIENTITQLSFEHRLLKKLFKNKVKVLRKEIDVLKHIGKKNFSRKSIALYGAPSNQLRLLALKKLKKASPKKKRTSKPYTTSGVARKKIERVLEKTYPHWKVKEYKKLASRLAVDTRTKTIKIRRGVLFKDGCLKCIVAHEIETHVARFENAKSLPYFIFRIGTPGYLMVEEGLGIYNEKRVHREKGEPYHYQRIYLRTLSVSWALQYSFSEVFAKLILLGMGPERAWEFTVRVKRGLRFTERPGAFTKDYLYFKGYNMIERFVALGGDIRTLYKGKIGIRDIPLIQAYIPSKTTGKTPVSGTIIIKDLASLTLFFKKHVHRPIFGVGVYAFHRMGLEDIIPNFHILALRDSLDTPLIEQSTEVISLERGMNTHHIQQPRNGTTIISHRRTIRYLKKFKKPILLVYKPSTKMEQVCKKNGWQIAIPAVRFGKALFENKILFRRLLKDLGISAPRGETISLHHSIRDLKKKQTIKEFLLLYRRLKTTYGLPFVIQHPTKGGGKGTFFVTSSNNFLETIKKLRIHTKQDEEREEIGVVEILISSFIKGSSPSITACVTKQGILSTNLHIQILDIPQLYNPNKGSGLFCGHDWSYSNFNTDLQNQAYKITTKIGNYFAKQGYKGIFGIDFVLDKKRNILYVTECNPRLLGSSPTLDMILVSEGKPPITAFHILEYMSIDYKIDVKEINQLLRQKKEGAHMMLHNLSGKWAQSHKEIKAGVYRLNFKRKKQGVNQNNLTFIRPGYGIKHLKHRDEFLITEGVPFKKSHFSPNRRIVRIITRQKVLKNSNHLNIWGRRVAKTIYQAFHIKPIRFFKIIKIVRPHFFAKG